MSRSAQRMIVYLAPTLAELDKNRSSSFCQHDQAGSALPGASSEAADSQKASSKKRHKRPKGKNDVRCTLLRTIESVDVSGTIQSGNILDSEPPCAEISVDASVAEGGELSAASGYWRAQIQSGVFSIRSDAGSQTESSIGEEERSMQSQLAAEERQDYQPVVTEPVSKSQRVRLGPARAVGMRRKKVTQPTTTRALKNDEKLKLLRPGPRPLSGKASTRDDTSLGGQTTVESIPPPPIHIFSLSKISPILSILRSPNTFLSSYHGGNQESARKFNILALVSRVGGMETCADWKAGGGKMMDRCEIVVKDISGCSIKIVLEGECAAKWAHPQASQRWDSADAGASMESTDAGLLEASILDAQDDSNGQASRSTMEIQRMNRLYPLRPGDVVVMSCLTLSRPRKKKLLKQCNSSFEQKELATVYAVASPSSNTQLELCWRSDVQDGEDTRRNFDQSLTAFDARCKAIHRLAQLWSA